MPAPDTIPPGAPCWVDLMTSDTSRSREFYSQVFGWGAEEPAEQFGGYVNFTKNGIRIAGCMGSQPGEPHDIWSVYLATDDAAKTLETAVSHGGQIVVPAMAVSDLGTMAVITDAGGASMGIWQPGRHEGFGIMAEPGAPSWFELHATDYERAVEFYRDVFGWQTHVVSDTPEFRYTTLRYGEEMLAGIIDASSFPGSEPAHWSVYFGVKDADAALATISGLGGSVVRAAEDTPYGRLAGAADPMGARFNLVAANEAMPARGTA
jgi:uncharacterized protein